MQYRSGFCDKCNETRKFERDTPNHLLHFLITVILGILTAGVGSIVWLAIWILSSIQFGGWRCSQCGTSKSFLTLKSVLITFVFIIIGIGVYNYYILGESLEKILIPIMSLGLVILFFYLVYKLFHSLFSYFIKKIKKI